ncbi:MAG: GHMP kinase [Nanoarchaeota archaeon]|nr:GHMP kinase [Nanoarchaeota archaeon]
MIIAKAPLRVSFAGGGTDLKEFYHAEPGSVTSTAIDKYVYIAIHKYFHNKLLLKYSQTEIVDSVEEVKNTRIKECLRLVGISKGIEITVISDIPAGTGVGSSSTFTVALLHALHAYKGEHVSAERLAQEASHIEIEILKEPIGKQDQYISAYGGLNFIEFMPDDRVVVTPLICKKETLAKLNDGLLMFYVGGERPASSILTEQKEKTEDKRETLRRMKKLSEEIRDSLTAGDMDRFGIALHQGWMEKKQVTGKISNSIVDEYYDKGIAAGAKGGKLIGAGGGGFLVFYCDRDKKDKVRLALNLKEVNINLDPQGSRVVYVGD